MNKEFSITQENQVTQPIPRGRVLSGGDLVSLFGQDKDVKNNSFQPRTAGVSREVIKTLATDTRNHLQKMFPGVIENRNGQYKFDETTHTLITRVGNVIRSLGSHGEILRLPDTNPERSALTRTMVDSLVDHQGEIFFMAPVCPDYGGNENFYRTMGGGISKEAQAAINATRHIMETFSANGFVPRVAILVADTEDDSPEILANCAQGDVLKYKESCNASAQAVRIALPEENVEVRTFTDALGDDFRTMQYAYEKKIRSLMDSDQYFAKIVEAMGVSRTDRHGQILGRKEQDYELTVRYMAQYAALGSMGRRSIKPAVFMNYDTPNRAFYNAVAKHKDLVLSEEDRIIMPVIGTVKGR